MSAHPPDDPEATLARRRSGSGATRRAEPRGDGPPERVASYQVLREIGRGGMGVVYEALDGKLGRRVALKSVSHVLAWDSAAFDRLEREARCLAAVNHPNVATIHGLEEADGERWLVLELVEGTSLARRIRDGLPLGDALHACAQVAAGLAAAHESGVVHGDLKPANVMLTPKGVVKVLDFGLSRQRRASRVAPSRGDDDGIVVGTPGYMSPEQVRGAELDERADAWAFGCVLHECLTGRPAFPGATTEERIAATLVHDPDIASLPAGVPAPVRELLASCLAREPAARPASLADVQRVLEEALGRVGGGRAAAASRAGRAAGNVPHAVSRFIGRDAQVGEIARLLDSHALVTLTGPGGCGKTRLACEVAHRLAPGLPGGAWVVELAALADEAAVAEHAARVLGLPSGAAGGPAAALASALAEARLLLILDNCEHLVAACAALASTLLSSCPGVRVLATSREPLGVAGERTSAVPPLDVPRAGSGFDEVAASEAVRLFVDRARLASPSFELTPASAAPVRAACERLDGIPLALELAAARMRHLSIEQIVERLDDRFRLLTGGSRSALPRQQTLRATIDWSHDQLAPDEQAAFRRMSAFRGGFTLDMAEAVLAGGSLAGEDVVALVSSLVDKSLLGVVEGEHAVRYRPLETIRQYAVEKLAGSGEAGEVRRRHASAVLALLLERPAAAGPAEAEWLRRVALDAENVLEAIDTSLADEEGVERALRLTGGAWPHWLHGGHWRAGFDRCEAVLARAPDASQALRGPVIAGGSALAWRLGDSARAHALSVEDLASRTAEGDRRGMAFALRSLGRLALDRAELHEAEVHLEESLALSRALGDLHGAGLTIRLLSLVADLRDDRARERALTEESLELCERIGDRLGITSSRNNLGLVLRDEGDLEGARAHLEAALATAEEIAFREMIATASNNLGLVACDRGDAPAARRLLLRSLAIRREIGDVRLLGSSFVGLSVLAALEGDATRAARLLGAARRLERERGAITGLQLDRQRTAQAAASALGEAAFAAALADGEGRPLDDALALAWAAPGEGSPAPPGSR